jgi:hypothetical protein
MNGAPSLRERPFPLVRRTLVTTRALVVQAEPLGIVIRSGAPKPKPVKFWAYLWAADEEDTVEQHWHQRVPSEHAA